MGDQNDERFPFDNTCALDGYIAVLSSNSCLRCDVQFLSDLCLRAPCTPASRLDGRHVVLKKIGKEA